MSKNLKIALVGYGGMNKVVHQISEERGHQVLLIVAPSLGKVSDSKNCKTSSKLKAEDLENIDVVIDFSLGDFALENAEICKEAGVDLVIGSTGWYERMAEMQLLADDKTGTLWSSNFSIGVNMYFKIVEAGAKLVNNFDEYDVWGHEIHHYNKADSPSGTAKTLEKILLENIDRKTEVAEDRLNRKIKPNELHFSSLRSGPVNFEHIIGLDSAADTIKISHAARNRNGYALGAVKAAEWLHGKKGFYGMEDFLNF